MSRLEHVNLTVPNNEKTAAWMKAVFGWHVRWQGDAVNGEGRTIHIGTEDDYIALYTPKIGTEVTIDSQFGSDGLNHIGVVVEDLDAKNSASSMQGLHPSATEIMNPGGGFISTIKMGRNMRSSAMLEPTR